MKLSLSIASDISFHKENYTIYIRIYLKYLIFKLIYSDCTKRNSLVSHITSALIL